MMKRNILITKIIAVILVMLTFIPFKEAIPVNANQTCGENITWTFDGSNGTLIISGYGEMNNFTSDVPAPWKNYREQINTVKISDGIKKIGDRAFFRCSSLSSVTMPNSVVEIGIETFSSCVNLQNVSLPETLKKIGRHSFSGCSKLNMIVIPDGLEELPANIFSNCTSLQYAIISKDSCIEKIGENAFYNCNLLEKIFLPDSLTEIGKMAFFHCFSLHDVVIPDGAKTVGSQAFDSCKNLTSIIIPSSINSVGRYAFFNCGELVIYGEINSYAQEYAKDNKINFIVIGAQEKAQAPIASINSGEVEKQTRIMLSTVTDDANIYYTTNGEDPNAYSSIYIEPIIITKDTIIKAIAIKDGYLYSDIVKYVYTALPYKYTITYHANGGENVPLPQIKIEDVNLVITSDAPTRNGYKFLGWSDTVDSTQAKYKPGDEYTVNSDIELYAVWREASVSDLTITASDCIGGKSITITSSMPNVSIYYTIDGTIPTEKSSKYTKSFKVSSEGITTIKAIGVRPDYENSSVCSLNVKLEKLPKPSFYFDGQNLIINNNSDAEIYYASHENPTENDSFYENPLKVISDKKVYAIAIKKGFVNSDIALLGVSIKNFSEKKMTDVERRKYITNILFDAQRTDETALSCLSKDYYVEEEKNTYIKELVYSIIGTEENPYKQIKLLHEWTVDNIYYDFQSLNDMVNGKYPSNLITDPYNLLTKVENQTHNVTVCEGYSNLMSAFARTLNIPCKRVRVTSTTLGHEINYFYIDGKWVIADTTNNHFNIEKDYWKYNERDRLGIWKDFDQYSYAGEEVSQYTNADVKNGTIIIPEGTEYISEFAFYGIEELKYIEIPSSVKVISTSAFERCKNLESIQFENGLEFIAENAFIGCDSLKEAILPNSLKYIGALAFFDCDMLEKVDLGDSVQYIQESAFSLCDRLKELQIPNTVLMINDIYSSNEENKCALYFEGNAPECKYIDKTDCIIYYYENAEGFDESAWDDIPKFIRSGGIPEYRDDEKAVISIELKDNNQSYLTNIRNNNLYNVMNAKISLYDENNNLINTIEHNIPNQSEVEIFSNDIDYRVYKIAVSLYSNNKLVLTTIKDVPQLKMGFITECTKESIIAKIAIENPSENMKIYIAAYNKLGVLVDVEETQSIDGENQVEFCCKDIYKIKAFVWESFDSLKPLLPSKEIIVNY